MPDPGRFKDKRSFMAKCVPEVIREGKSPEAAAAQCHGMWRQHMKKKRQSHELQMPSVCLQADVLPATLNAEDRTVELLFYAGSTVEQFNLMDGLHHLSFSLESKAIRMERMKSGKAPLKGGHAPNSDLSALFGVIEDGWLAADGVHARVRFSRRADVEPFFQDVRDGILTNVSMEARIYAADDVTEKGAAVPHFHATDWEPRAIAMVSAGADQFAHALAERSHETNPCTIHRAEASAEAPNGGNEMKIKVRLLADVDDVGKLGDIVEIDESDFDEALHAKELKAPTAAAPSGGAPSDAEAEARLIDRHIAADKARRSKIREIAVYHDLDEVWAEAQHQSGVSMEQVLARAEAERRKRAPKVGPNDIGFGDDYSSRQFRLDAMADALAARGRAKAPPEPARPYANMTFAELALASLQLSGKGRGLDARRDRADIFSANLALHTTSDFPLLLANALNKILLPEYENRMPTYRQLAARRDFRDYRVHNFNRSGDFPVPLQVGEHGEYQYGTMGENREQVTLAKFGRILGITRETLINDDLGAFTNLAMKAARRVSDFENATFYTVCILAGAGLGPNLSDAVAVYNAAHGNVLSAGALDLARLDEARELMLSQTSIDGIRINVMPRYLLVPPASAGLAERLTAPQAMLNLAGDGAGTPVERPNFNNWAGRLVPVTDGNLTGTRYYLLADPAELEQYIYGYLEGSSGPRTEVRNGFSTDGVELKVALDFGVGAIEFRAGVTGAGQ